MKKLVFALLILGVGLSNMASAAVTANGISIVEENDWYIPVGMLTTGGVSKEEFDKVLDKIEKVYRPIIAAKGGKLDLQRAWDDGTVNAYASRSGKTYTVKIYGGIARHEVQTADGLALVVCHEVGHHIGGAPKMQGGWWSNSWASIEGQADYYGVLKCLKRVWSDEDNNAIAGEQELDPFMVEKCKQVYNTDADLGLCARLSNAGMVLGKLFHVLKNEAVVPRFDTPDRNVVNQTKEEHPATQCRVDTYFQAALCAIDYKVDTSDSSPLVGTCNESENFNLGIRPRCWYKP